MNLKKRFLTLAFFVFMIGIGLTYEASAQTRVITVRRPVVVRNYVYRDPFWRSRYYSPYYDSYYYSPYLQYQERKFALQSDLAGNRRELDKHLRKYRADGVITPKERRELEDDYKDVRKSGERLRRFTRYYESNL